MSGLGYTIPAVLAVLRNRLDDLDGMLKVEPDLVRWQFDELEIGATAGRTARGPLVRR